MRVANTRAADRPRGGEAPADPDAVAALDMVEETDERRRPPGPAHQTHVEADQRLTSNQAAPTFLLSPLSRDVNR
jgi:hypothetical protein